MFRFAQKSGPLTRPRRRNHQLTCEALESRQMLSAYYIVNESSGKVLDDPNFSTSNGTKVIQYQLNGGANQLWNIEQVKSGYDVVVNSYSGEVLADPNNSGSNGTKIVQQEAQRRLEPAVGVRAGGERPRRDSQCV